MIIVLNSFGFLNIDSIKTDSPEENSGNFALLDILKALNWVHQNASVFGGDSNNITVCGFSSGARNALSMLVSPLFRNKFHKLISISGGFTTFDPKIGSEINLQALSSLGTGYLDKNQLLNLAAEKIVPLMSNANIRMRIFPHLFADGYVIPQKRESMKIPMIFTSAASEFNSKILGKFYDYDEREFAAKYGNLLFSCFNAEKNAEWVNSDNIYLSRIKWGTNPQVVGEREARLIGAAHGLDLCLMLDQRPIGFSAFGDYFSDKNKIGRKQIGSTLRNYFGNFLRTGNPNGNKLEHWSNWKTDQKILLVDGSRTEASFSTTKNRIIEEDVFQEILHDNTLRPGRKKHIVENILSGRFFSDSLERFWETQKSKFNESPNVSTPFYSNLRILNE